MNRRHLLVTAVTLSTWLVLASIAAIAVVGVASAQAPKPFPKGYPQRPTVTITCPPTVPNTPYLTRPDGWMQIWTNGLFVRVFYEQPAHRISCQYRSNPGDVFTWLERQVDNKLVNCKVATNAVVCEQALQPAPLRP